MSEPKKEEPAHSAGFALFQLANAYKAAFDAYFLAAILKGGGNQGDRFGVSVLTETEEIAETVLLEAENYALEMDERTRRNRHPIRLDYRLSSTAETDGWRVALEATVAETE